MESPRKATPKKEFPPDPAKEAFEGSSFTSENILVLAKMQADGKQINAASFKGTKFKLYEGGVKSEIDELAKRITKIYKRSNIEGTHTAKISLDAVSKELERDKVRSNPSTKDKLDAQIAEDFKKEKDEQYKNRPVLSVDTNKIEETIHTSER